MPAKPKENGKQERSGGYVKSNALKGRRFSLLQELNACLVHRNRTWARVRIHGTTRHQVFAHFQEIDQKALTPLASSPFAFFQRGTRTVHPDGHVEALMYDDPASWHALVSLLAEVVADCLRAQVEAGAQAVQLFDSWIGTLNETDYHGFSPPHVRRIFEALATTGVPQTHFGTGGKDRGRARARHRPAHELKASPPAGLSSAMKREKARGMPDPTRPPKGEQDAALPGQIHATYQDILDNVAEGVYFVDRDRRITFWNHAATEISGHPRESVVGHRCPEGPLQHIDMEGRLLCQTMCPLAHVLRDGQPRQADVLLRHRAGHRVPVRISVRPIRSQTGEVTGAVETFTDITTVLATERRAAELERLAFIDTLTGLANRQFGERQLESALSELDRHQRPFGLLLLDIDHFKDVNDNWGHQTGDAVLRAVGRTLSGAARAEDFVARWGGEEFLVIVREDDLAGLDAAAERFRRMVAAAGVKVGSDDIGVRISIGGALARKGESGAELLRRADTLLYRSKQEGRNRVTIEE